MSEVFIPIEKARELCMSFREKHQVRMFSKCWGCIRFSKGVSEKMCFFKPPNNDGCRFVVEEYKLKR